VDDGAGDSRREPRAQAPRQVRRTPVRRNIDEVTFDEEREIVIGGDDKPQVSS